MQESACWMFMMVFISVCVCVNYEYEYESVWVCVNSVISKDILNGYINYLIVNGVTISGWRFKCLGHSSISVSIDEILAEIR